MNSTRNTLIEEATDVCSACRTHGIEVRIFGSVGAAIVGELWFKLHPKRKRELKDIDLVGEKSTLNDVRRILCDRGFREVVRVAIETEGDRAIFGNDTVLIDFSTDELRFAQKLPILDRLTVSFPTLSATDLILEKLQIVSPKPAQIIDFLAVLCSTGTANLEFDYLQQILGRRWSYWHSASRFLVDAKAFATSENLLDELSEIDQLVDVNRNLPKTMEWNMRSWFGSVLPWHNVVEAISEDRI